MTTKTRRNGKGAIVRDKAQPTVTKRGADPVAAAVAYRAGRVAGVAAEEQRQNRNAASVFASLQRVANGIVTPEHAARGLHLDPETNPRAYAAALAAARQVADAPDRAEAMKAAAGKATTVQEVIDAEGDRPISRFEIYQRVTGRHPH